jgi:hypothetical protein
VQHNVTAPLCKFVVSTASAKQMMNSSFRWQLSRLANRVKKANILPDDTYIGTRSSFLPVTVRTGLSAAKVEEGENNVASVTTGSYRT